MVDGRQRLEHWQELWDRFLDKVEIWHYRPWLWTKCKNQTCLALSAIVTYHLWNYLSKADLLAHVVLWVPLPICLFLVVLASFTWHQSDLDRYEAKAKRVFTKAELAKRHWGVIRSMVRLTNSGTVPYQGLDILLNDAPDWPSRWRYLAQERRNRREYFERKTFNLGALTKRTYGVMLVVAIPLVFFMVVEAYWTLCIPWLGLGPWMNKALFMLGIVMWVKLLADYIFVCLVDPGLPEGADMHYKGESYSFGPAVSVGSSIGVPSGDDCCHEHSQKKAKKVNEARWCDICGIHKPPRSYHCKVCRRCVLKMDHHCPLVNQCVGLHNHRRFCILQFDLFVTSTFMLIFFIPRTVAAIMELERFDINMAHLTVVSLVALITSCVSLPFFLYHLGLIFKDKTTLESMKRIGRQDDPSVEEKIENYARYCGEPPPGFRPHFKRLMRIMIPLSHRLGKMMC